MGCGRLLWPGRWPLQVRGDGVGSLADPSSSALWPNLMTQPCSRFQAWRETENEEEGIQGVMKKA